MTATGPGRAGRVGELLCAGGVYKGEALAGQPHGQGQFFAAQVQSVCTDALAHSMQGRAAEQSKYW